MFSKKNFSNLGIEVGNVKLNLEKMMQNKEKAVSILTKGVEFLFKKNKITYFKGVGSFKSVNKISILNSKKVENIIETEKTIISTGSEPLALPKVDFDEKKIVSSTGALSLKTVPKKMLVVGGGYIGLEMGSVWSRLGTEVHVVEFLDHITPGMDNEISKEFLKILQKQGIKFHLEAKVENVRKKTKGVVVTTSNKDGKKLDFDCDVVLIAVGRKPNTKNLNLEKIGINLDNKKRIKVVHHDLKAELNPQIKSTIGKIDYIAHLAAGSHVDRSIDYPLEFVMDNVLGTAHILDYARNLDHLEMLILKYG